MNRERAETHLRQLAEAELRRAVKLPAGSIPGRWNSARLALVAQALSAVDAVVADTAAEIEANLDLAVAGGCPLYRRDAPWPPGKRAAPGLSTGRTQSASHRASRRIVPVGKVIQIRNEDLRRELLLVAFVQSAGGARFTMAGWPFRRFTAVDDQGASYQVGFAGGHAAGELLLRPDPPHPIRWLDLTTAPGEPATRIDLSPQVPAPDVIVTRKAHSPGELLLDVAAAWILTSAAAFPQDTPERLAAANPELLPHPAAGLGDIVAALQAAEALSPASPVPGQLAELCARLGISGHGILASVGGGLPERWQSMLSRYHRREPYPAPPTGRVAATVAELPDLDGAWVVILGLHHSEDTTILHMLASGVTTGDDWAYTRGVRPPPVVWIRDSSGRWHTTRTDGATPSGNTGDVMWWLEIVPPLDRGTAWIDVVTAGQSAEVRATLPLRWESAP
jgi:hypothetical protein